MLRSRLYNESQAKMFGSCTPHPRPFRRVHKKRDHTRQIDLIAMALAAWTRSLIQLHDRAELKPIVERIIATSEFNCCPKLSSDTRILRRNALWAFQEERVNVAPTVWAGDREKATSRPCVTPASHC